MGLKVYEIYDLDKAYDMIYTTENPRMKLGPDGNDGMNLRCFLASHPNLHNDIQGQYDNKVYTRSRYARKLFMSFYQSGFT